MHHGYLTHDQNLLAYCREFPPDGHGDNTKHGRVNDIATNTSTVLSVLVTYPMVTPRVGLPDVV